MKYNRRRLLITVIAASASLLSACGGGHGSQPVIPQTSMTNNAQTAITTAEQVQSTEGSTTLSAASLAPASAFMPSTRSSIGLFQIFDETNYHTIFSGEAQQYGSRYHAVWGARPGMPTVWRSNAPALQAAYYLPSETDASTTNWGAIGRSLDWWRAHHPDWILYRCTAAGAPTSTPAYISGLPTNVPLDIHNPAVVQYQARLAGDYAVSHGYNAVAFDEVTFWNPTLQGNGSYGCAVRAGGKWVRRYASAHDPQWTSDMVAWAKAARAVLRTSPELTAHHLTMIVNHPASPITNPGEQELLQNVDADLNETGFSNYGRYRSDATLFKTTLDWTIYGQQHGVAILTNDQYAGTAITRNELEYSIATYLMANEQSSALFTGSSTAYGAQQYHLEYATNYGTACGRYYGGAAFDPRNPNLYYRKLTNALVLVNAGSTPQVARLSRIKPHTDIENRPVTNPLTIAPHDAYVLLNRYGCQ
ncbi:MAG: hypothetical protein ACXWNK_15685 [Vulcanimicrobiaceae bacterium]